MTAGLTATGWVPKTATELLAELETDVRAEIGRASCRERV